jgi:hypothetical protein
MCRDENHLRRAVIVFEFARLQTAIVFVVHWCLRLLRLSCGLMRDQGKLLLDRERVARGIGGNCRSGTRRVHV